jgi:hypothetical protein
LEARAVDTLVVAIHDWHATITVHSKGLFVDYCSVNLGQLIRLQLLRLHRTFRMVPGLFVKLSVKLLSQPRGMRKRKKPGQLSRPQEVRFGS